ncbi:CorA family divalent cation transporter [Sphingomonas immobilis]|uniref:CorA family divalent cation transporter n=1 Tax=Sphingomonas immobilis TaxID=3063997 RepID=A0ABT9A1I5_9SPHN|nr:CorA family divalent cation transporter [Sphingomonas sp. CA1-15]MDO7843690.1 CorA family divalent cation transporter [Sphingomonas sp. CA1-15]
MTARRESEEAIVAFAALVNEPGLIWAATHEDGVMHVRHDFTEALVKGHARTTGKSRRKEAEAPFLWLHLNLADQRTHAWMLRENLLPREIADLLLGHEHHPTGLVEEDAIGLVFQDFARDLGGDSEGLSALHVAIRPGLVISGRYHPVQCADLIRRRLDRAPAALDHTAALALILDVVSSSFSKQARDLALGVQTADDQFHSGDRSAAQAVSGVRRQAARLHRLTGGLKAVLHRLEEEPELPDPITGVVERYAQRLSAIDGDIAATQGQMRALREELDLLAAQKTNSNLYFLSMMSALLLPATLVTGFFGMNTSDLPFSSGGMGTAEAAVIAVVSSLGTWLLLRYRN